MFKFEMGAKVRTNNNFATIKGRIVERRYTETQFDNYVTYVVQVKEYGVYTIGEAGLEIDKD